MRDSDPTLSVDQLLGHTAWARRLALALVRDEASADDLLQETWLAAMRRPPADGSSPRAWLASVMRRLANRGRERDGARGRRERETARPEAQPGTDQLIERAARHREVVEEVLALDEPYRQVLLLRHFEELPPRRIAALLDLPIATVSTRLQRGQARLRERLEARYGGDGRWCLALGPLLAPPLAQTLPAPVGPPSSAELLSTALTVKTLAVAGGALGLVALVVLTLESNRPETVGDGGPTARATAALQPATVSRAVEDSAASAEPAPRVAVVPESVPATPVEPVEESAEELRLRLVDLVDRPLGGFALRRPGALDVRWQGGDPVWVNGGGESLQISLEDQARLRSDRRFAEDFIEARRHPEAWRTELFDTPLPERDFWTAGDGSFAVDPDELRGLRLVDRGWTLLARAVPEVEGALAKLVAVPAVQLGGTVVDADGRPVSRARVRLAPGASGLLGEVSGRIEEVQAPPEIYSDALGRFVLRDVPSAPGLEFELSAEGYAPFTAAVPFTDDYSLVVELGPLERPPLVFAGTVVDGGSAPVPDARIFLGTNSLNTDAEGRFRFELASIEPSASLAVVRAPFQALQREDFGAQLAARPGAFEDELIVLADEARTLRGRVVDERGDGLAGVSLNLFDASLPDTSFSTLERLAGDRERWITADANGAFELTGLADRDYRVRVFDAERPLFHVTEPIRAGAGSVELVVPEAVLGRTVSGRVVDREGEPLAGAMVAVSFNTFVNRSGRGTMNERGPLVRCDGDGRFELAGVPAAHAWIGVGSEALAPSGVPVEWVPAGGELELVYPPSTPLQVTVVGARSGDVLRAFDAAGRPVDLEVWRPGGGPTAAGAEVPVAGGSARVATPPTATQLSLVRGGEELDRAAVESLGGRIVPVRLDAR